MNLAVDAASKRGAKAVRAEYIPTAKNAFVRDLYPRLGFTPLDGDLLPEGATRWHINLLDYERKETHIATEVSV
jgi:predicted enzyme involved in methoxymalonyl-ACP biosynthesis